MEVPNKRVPVTVGAMALVSLMAASLLPTTGGVSAQGVRTVDFQRDIQPLLKESCYGCHGPTQQNGSLRFDQRSSVCRGNVRLRPGMFTDLEALTHAARAIQLRKSSLTPSQNNPLLKFLGKSH